MAIRNSTKGLRGALVAAFALVALLPAGADAQVPPDGPYDSGPTPLAAEVEGDDPEPAPEHVDPELPTQDGQVDVVDPELPTDETEGATAGAAESGSTASSAESGDDGPVGAAVGGDRGPAVQSVRLARTGFPVVALASAGAFLLLCGLGVLVLRRLLRRVGPVRSGELLVTSVGERM